ncbi:MAG: hypothetical protein ACFE8A_13495 [Candidatus Hodarchaeota archaeon]
MKVKKRSIKKGFILALLISSIFISTLLFLVNNSLASKQNDEDIETTIHCTLKTDSTEIHSTLMQAGTYTFWDEPELDIGPFSHDSTRIDVSNIQLPIYNSTDSFSYNKTDGLTGNFTLNTTDGINGYTLSAQFDTTIQVNITFTRNYSCFSGLIESYSVGTPAELYDITWDGKYFYLMDREYKRVYKYPSDFSSYITYYSIPATNTPLGIVWVGGYFYITDDIYDYVFRYNSDFSSYITYNIGSISGPGTYYGICYDGEYFYVIDQNIDEINKYPSDFRSEIASYDVGALGGNDFPYAIEWDGEYFYVTDGDAYVYKYPSDFTEYTSYNLYELSGDESSEPVGIAWDGFSFYIPDIYEHKVYRYHQGSLFDVYVSNFTYQKLGVDYYENFTLLYDSSISNLNTSETSGDAIFYFDSSMFSQYDYINDIIVPEQNLTLIFDLSLPNVQINMTLVILYSSNTWRVATEVALTINGEECIDSTYNSGFVLLSTYPPSLLITTTEAVYFRLNITVDFTFTFDLEIISKTYLRKRFKLESDHLIYIEQMVFDSNLNIKKIYLNNLDKGNSNPCSLSPPVSQDTGNIFLLEIILIEEIYLPLHYLYNSLGSGTSNIYLSGISNILTYYNINGNHLYSIILPSGWNPEHANLTFSNLEYLPDYTPDYSQDQSGYSSGSGSYGNEDVSWSQRYYQTNQNGSFLEDSDGSGYENVYSEYFNTLNTYMSHNYGGLDGYNSTYTVSDYLYMQNKFPQELNYEDWTSWVHTYNSEYISSSFDNTGVNLTSILNVGSDSSVPSNTSFSFVNGTQTQNGSLWDIDSDYSIFNAGFIEWNYTGISVSAGDGDPLGMTTNGTHIFITGNQFNAIREFDERMTYVTSHDISSETGTPFAICFNGTHFFVGGNTEDRFFVYDSDWDYTGVSHDVSGQDGTLHGLAWNGTHFFFKGGANNKIFVYNSTFDYTGISYDVSGQDGNGIGVYFNGTHFFMVGYEHLSVFIYDSNWDYTGVSYYIGHGKYPMGISANSTHWFVVDRTADAILIYSKKSDLELNFTSEFTFATTGMQTNDTIDFIQLYYSQKTNESIEISFSIWNWVNSVWNLVNSSTNKDNFYNLYFTLNSSHYDGSNTIRLKWYGYNATDFELYIDKLSVLVNWTKTSGEIYSTITKEIDFTFLDRYDGYSSYQKLYNVTIEFQYRYSNYTKYSEFAQFDYDSNSYTLIKDEAWHKISLDFEFDSLNVPNFTVMFNITNGLLELNSNLNYTIFFKCLLNTSYYDNFPDNLNWESLGETNPSWVDSSELYGAEVIIVNWQDHNKVLRLNNVVGMTPYIVHSFDTPGTSGTVELYIGSSDVSKSQQWIFAEPTKYNFFLRISNSKLYYLDSGFTEHEIQSVVSNTWYHIKAVWRVDNTYDVYIDNIKMIDNMNMVQNQIVGVSALLVQTTGGSGTYYAYTDAPSEVSHPKYNEGDNLRMREVTEIYQYFRYNPILNLDSLQEMNGNWILNFTFSFDPSTDAGIYNFFNSINHSLLHFNISIEHESGWSSVVYNYNTTQSDIYFTLNITSVLNGLGKNRFKGFYIEFYLAGNPSNFTLDNLTLYDFDSDFFKVQAIWIDTLVISHQEVSVYWKASDRYIDHIEIHQKFDDTIYLLHNGTLLNNTLQSFEFSNVTCGFYELNLTFYDNYSNWEKWTCNFTIWNRISISTGYKNPCLIGETNTVFVHLDTEYSIMDVYYDNSTDYIHQYSNSSYPIYEYEFNFTVNYNVETVYNISILVIGEYNDSFWCNITGLSFIERTTILDINNLYSSYYQDEQMNITFVLRDLYNNPLQNKLLNYTIEDPGGNYIVNGSGITNSYGNITYNLPFDISYTIGFYHLNVSFNGTKDYTSGWKLQSFQVRPILRAVNSTDFSLTVNNYPVVNNFIQINWTNNFTIANNNTATFDMSIVLKLNYTQAISYTGYLTHTNTFGATSDILSIKFDNATIFNYPSNFTEFYFDNDKSSNYAISGSRFTISDLVGDTYYNNNDFSILFTHMDTSQIDRIQLTDEPRTDINTVQFREYLTPNRTFSYWYFHNSLNISTVSLYHNRTSTTVPYSSFTIENNNYYFEKSCLSEDFFTASTSYWIDWDNYVNFEILTDNGTYCEIKITYQAPIDINNVTIVLDLKSQGLYAENWDNNATQSDLTYILELPHINFTTSQQTIILKGTSSAPVISFSFVINEDGFKISDEEWKIRETAEEWRSIKKANWEDLNEYIIGYLEIPKYSEAFRVNIESDWELDGIHYGNEYYDIQTNGYFECAGFGTGITTAFLKFKTNPLSNLKRIESSGEVVYKIYAKYRLDNIDFIFYIEETDYYNKQNMIKELEDEVDCDKIVEYYTVEDRIYYMIVNMDLDEGKNEIVINYEIERMANYAWLFLIIAIVLIGFGVIYITIRYTDNKIKDFINLDKIVKYFFWIKKSKREQLLKKNRYKPKKKIKKIKKG